MGGLHRETNDAHLVNTQRFKLPQSITQRGQHLGCALGSQDFGRGGIKGNNDGVKITLAREAHHVAKHGLMTPMHAIEDADCRDGTTLCRTRLVRMMYPHTKTLRVLHGRLDRQDHVGLPPVILGAKNRHEFPSTVNGIEIVAV